MPVAVRPMASAISEAIDRAQNDPRIRCLIITGGSGVFTAGNDIEDLLTQGTSTGETPPASDLLRKAAGVPKGSASQLRQVAGKVTAAQVRAIATQKLPDLNTTDVEQAIRSIEGTARSMGIQVVD